ncbi:YbhB/YbcL family Raf kinase inhibitor-like protein [Nonomuraea fuscirosea]|uniref:YbhB/YbcL family Raf kinase inhibitor-like protein n=1 Tax=Nonomuraea fuscirosea TaxID=1291556 RepID=UPI002DDB11AA|nr:YbhB/YbcL family Raf kinase inhibitor-like protein [Nonomuraea fuscirosea]WSA56127.1 YbhB/YbcL family Raf kinase inhibitor-like protein [Nonomuraea fuscirosea]
MVTRAVVGADPYARLPRVAAFGVRSGTVGDGDPWPVAQMHVSVGGGDVSPELSWWGAPEGSLSFAVTVLDVDAPTGSGFWHWAVVGVAGGVSGLPEGAGDEWGSGLPEGAYQLRNDMGEARFMGAAPAAGSGPDRYFVVVHALDVEDIGVPAGSTPAWLGWVMSSHVLGRAILVATAEIPA